MTKSEKTSIREYVENRYSSRDGRNVRICSNGSVTVDVDGNGSQMINGKDVSGGMIFAGWSEELLQEAREDR